MDDEQAFKNEDLLLVTLKNAEVIVAIFLLIFIEFDFALLIFFPESA